MLIVLVCVVLLFPLELYLTRRAVLDFFRCKMKLNAMKSGCNCREHDGNAGQQQLKPTQCNRSLVYSLQTWCSTPGVVSWGRVCALASAESNLS